MAPDWGLAPLVALATVATVVASQAVISGAYSVTRQAVQLGFWPRMQILHTSAVEKGQIYLPQVNALLLCAVLVLVLVFRNSDNLVAAYGFAVTGTMLTTSVLAFAVLPRGSTGAKRMLWWWRWASCRCSTCCCSRPTCSRSTKVAGCRWWWRSWCSR